MNVGQAIEYAREWVTLHGSQIPGFCGAHLMGGVLALPQDATFPSYYDLDLNIVCAGEVEAATYDVAYKGLILEYSTVSSGRYRSAEQVLANPELAVNLASGGILADPWALLAPLQQTVAAHYADRRWVQARCDYERRTVEGILAGLRQASAPAEALWLLTSAALFLAGLLAEASLRAPTHRRCLALLGEVLHGQGRADLHEATLGLLGWQHLRREQVEGYLALCAAAFDRAAAVTRTPVPFQYKLQPHVRPYIISGAQELIDEGHHREAMFWISGFLMFANSAIQCDAPEAERPLYQAQLDGLVAEMGLHTPGAIQARLCDAEALAEAIFALAGELAEGSHQTAVTSRQSCTRLPTGDCRLDSEREEQVVC